jgi:GntR family transcriptional regulator
MWIERVVDRDSPQKLYIQIYTIIKDRIEKNDWPANTHIPSEDELCRIFDVSKATVRLAISELARDGYVKRQQGKGTFVSNIIPQIGMGMTMKTLLTEDMFGEGVKVEKELLAKGTRALPDEFSAHLKSDCPIYFVQCKGSVEGEPVYVEELFLCIDLFPGIEEEDVCKSTFFDLIQERSIKKVFKVIQTIEVTKTKNDVAKSLKAKEGSPALLIHRILICADGTPMAFKRLIGRVGKYKIQTEFERIR